MEKPGYRSIDVRVFLLYYIIYRNYVLICIEMNKSKNGKMR